MTSVGEQSIWLKSQCKENNSSLWGLAGCKIYCICLCGFMYFSPNFQNTVDCMCFGN